MKEEKTATFYFRVRNEKHGQRELGWRGGFPAVSVEQGLYLFWEEWPRLLFTARIERPLLFYILH
jgi:hypothetical protein